MEIRRRYGVIAALYGDAKPDGLASLILSSQSKLVAAVPEFSPRPLHDVHSTIIGLESAGPVEQSVSTLDGIDVGGLGDYLARLLEKSPIMIQFGGFRDVDYSLTSRGRRPYERMLSASADKVVLIGWPVNASGEPTWRLDNIRRELRQFGARHRYHDTAESRDPDSYMVIGDLSPGYDARQLAESLMVCRIAMSSLACTVQITSRNTYMITYFDTRLPALSTTFEPLIRG